MPASERITGIIVKTHGIRGELVVNIHTDEPEKRFAPGSSVFLRTKTGVVQQYTIAKSRPYSGRLLLSLEALHDKEQAEELRGAQFFINDSDLGTPEDEDEFYDYQIENLIVQDHDHHRIGIVKEILHLPAGDVLSIKPTVSEKYASSELLLPFIQEFVPEINLEQGYLIVNPPLGLWEEI